ncbi:TonB-dependent receptor [Catenovulum agarivorans]|uniref:TonB-dependent receptor n=1 Tax=Catenovulum agarivorans TaxID=1172192 RepID=UPI00058E8313|nr:TonB-dependent receptor [Catenovulum agarivorans]
MAHNKNKVAGAVAAILGTVIAQQAIAEESAGATVDETIKVRGIRGSLIRAMDVKRDADGVVDAISAEDIGKFPDTNLAESLQRITGVSIDRSGGEGQLITVRGFGPQFNTVLVNGRQMASENDTRAFSFDTIASELVSGLDVHKTSTATMQSGGIGSTININTARPLNNPGFKLAASAKAVYDENSEETSPQVSALISNTFADDSVGVLFALSHQQRKTRLNQAQMDGWLEFAVDQEGGIHNPQTESGADFTGQTIFSPRNYDHKVTFEERKRTNANLVLQYRPSSDLTLTADVLYSDFDIETDATSYGHWFTAPNIQGVEDDGDLFDANGDRVRPTVDANGTVIDLYQEVGLATDMHAKKFDRLTETVAIGFNADWQVTDSLNLEFDVSHSTAERAANNGRGNQLSLIGYANRVRFQVDDNILPLASMFVTADSGIYSGQQELDGALNTGTPDNVGDESYFDADGFPAYNPEWAAAGVSDHLDKSNSRAHVMLRRGWAVEDEVTQFRIDGDYKLASDFITAVKFGVQHSSETKDLVRWDNEGVGIHCTYCGYPDNPVILESAQYVFDAGSDFLSDVSGSGRMPTSWLAHDGEANFAFLEQQSGSNFDAVRRNNSFTVEEETVSAYAEVDLETEFSGMYFTANAGLRVESTDISVDGTQEQVVNLKILDKTEMLAEYGSAKPISESKSYDSILPNFSAKLEITDDLVARMGLSRTLTRPTLQSMSPATVITTTRQGGNLTSTSGNPELEPFESDNFDLSLEYYFGDASYASVGYFRKNVANFIVNTKDTITFDLPDGGQLTDPSTGSDTNNPDASDGIASFTNTLPINGEDATVDGWEIAFQHTFDSGFGAMANATLVDSNAQLDPTNVSQVFALTGLSDSLNLVGFYEDGPLQIRLAWNWRDQFVQSLTQVQGNGPTIVEDYDQWDLSGSYDISDDISIFFEGINLTESYVHKRGRFDNHLLLVEDSGRRFAVGVRGSF